MLPFNTFILFCYRPSCVLLFMYTYVVEIGFFPLLRDAFQTILSAPFDFY